MQTSASHSIPEAEIVALDAVARAVALLARDLWEAIPKRAIIPTLEGDNAACVTVVTSGNNPTMRHLERTQHCSVKWLHEEHERGLYNLNKVETNLQAA
eukprot:8351302-Alexandrium_andersonii.AAC.1